MANVKKFKKGQDIQISTNFNQSEFDCRCSKCSETLIDMDHLERLQQLRHDLGSSIRITSAYRCPDHNTSVGGAKNSQHMKGTATDIQVSGMSPDEVADACESFDGLGRYDTFTHIDSRGSGARWDKRTVKDQLPSGPSVDDIEVTLEDIEKELGL